MSLSKSEIARTLPYPMQAGDESSFPDLQSAHDNEPILLRYTRSPALRATADLIDLVAGHRGDLMQTLLTVLGESRTVRKDAEELMALAGACGLAETASPCAAAMAISADLERLVAAVDRWTHPAQVIKKPDSQALARLCASRLEREEGLIRERLERIQPRLDRAARLTEKAASRRGQETGRRAEWVDRWLE